MFRRDVTRTCERRLLAVDSQLDISIAGNRENIVHCDFASAYDRA
jgi:hypothetical protein